MSDVVALADEYWDRRLANRHFINLMMGELRHLEQWNDLSADGLASWRSELDEILNRTEHTGADSQHDQVLLETVRASAFSDRHTTAFWPEITASSRQSGLISTLFPSLTLQPLATESDGRRYIEKLHRFPAMIEQLADRMEEGAKAGVVPLALHARQTMAKLDDLLAVPVADDPILAQPGPADLDDRSREAWRDGVADALDRSFRPGLARFRRTLEDVSLPAGRSEDRPGLVHVPGGPEVYGKLVAAHTTLELDADTIHRIGLEQIERIESEYVRLGGPLLGTDDLGEIYRRLREDPELHFTEPDEVVAESLRCLDKAAAVMGDWFDPVPKAPCIATATDIGAMAFYRPPSEDGIRPGQFFFNIADPSAWARFQVPAIAYHEGIPGHHLQFALGIENRQVHDLHRRIYLSAFGEGWGLYTEQLSDEMGLYENDWERIGMLMADSLRAGRLVVDTGMHALGWTRQQAIDYLADHSPMAMHEIAEEIDRYIASPGQALSYMIGRLEIQDIRAAAEQRLGAAFDIKRFHGVVLGNGTVPLPTLRRMVEETLA